MDQNCCVPKKEALTNTLMDTGHMLSDLDKLVEELSDKLHGVPKPKIAAEGINVKELDRVPGILEVADKNMQAIRTLYVRLSELVKQL